MRLTLMWEEGVCIYGTPRVFYNHSIISKSGEIWCEHNMTWHKISKL